MAKKITSKEKSHIATESDKVGEIAHQYGFTVIHPPHITSDDISKAKQFKEYDYYGDTEEKVALTRWYIDEQQEKEAQPLALFYKKPFRGSSLKKKSGVEMYGLELMGSNRSTSEALLLKTTLAILDDLGYKDVCIDINSIGDRESISKFEKELHSYHRKHFHLLPAKMRTDFKKNHYSVLRDKTEETESWRQSVPQPIASLSDLSRAHFKEVLECIETFEIVYKINPGILSNKLYSSYTVFEVRSISDKGEGELLAYGYRYNHMAKKLGGKREVPSIGATIMVKKHPLTAKKVLIKNIKKPKYYLVQLGGTAKLKALNVVEMLRKHKIPVYHSITKDKITGQLSGAEYMKATHVLIMGQKEAIENSIVVRNVNNREQETVSLRDLPEFLKKLG